MYFVYFMRRIINVSEVIKVIFKKRQKFVSFKETTRRKRVCLRIIINLYINNANICLFLCVCNISKGELGCLQAK